MTPPKFKHAILYGDTHFPFQDKKALECIKRIVADVKPDVLVHMGDLFDCWQISKFDKEIERRDTLQETINAGCAHLNEMFMLTPNAERYLLEGNHEHRLARTINRASDTVREVMRLDVMNRFLSWPGLLLDRGITPDMWEFVPYRGQTRRRIFPRFVLKHGDKVSPKSGYSGYREMDRYGASGASGHTHRLGHVFHNDFNGAHTWIETGCTCDLLPTYCEDPDWQHGCVIITFTNDYKFFNPTVVYIQQGNAIYGDARYKC
jgi:predicted phosphodiesterase